MLLGEPQRTQADLNFVLFGFPVRIHPFFWIVALLLGLNSKTPADVLTWILALFFSILVHELGHATMMRRYGFQPWITLYGMGGLASYAPGGSVGSRGHTPLAQVLISLAGPGAGFLLAALIVGLILLSGHGVLYGFGAPYGLLVMPSATIGSEVLTEWIRQVLFISITWGVVNLMPVYPLDGGQIARELLLVANPRNGIRQSLMLSIFTAAGLGVIGLFLWKSIFVGIFFGYLAFISYAALQAYSGRGRGW